MDHEHEDHLTASAEPRPRVPPPRTSAEATEAVTFWDPPEVMGLVLTWVITVAVLLLGVGVGVLLTLTQGTAGNAAGGGGQPSLSPAAPFRTTQPRP